jgi:hypothetical protein
MTPEQALALLLEVTKELRATRETHQAIIVAIETLKKAITPAA